MAMTLCEMASKRSISNLTSRSMSLSSSAMMMMLRNAHLPRGSKWGSVGRCRGGRGWQDYAPRGVAVAWERNGWAGPPQAKRSLPVPVHRAVPGAGIRPRSGGLHFQYKWDLSAVLSAGAAYKLKVQVHSMLLHFQWQTLKVQDSSPHFQCKCRLGWCTERSVQVLHLHCVCYGARAALRCRLCAHA